MSIISLLSDFGLKDPYVAEMKAVILSIKPEITLIDISHEIEKFNIRMGAYCLASAVSYFPSNTIHSAVVDPGVGTKRKSIIVKTQNSILVGPDNGLLMLAASKHNIKKVYSIENSKYMLSNVSNTFHGRDIFSPVAAYIAKGVEIFDFGKAITDYILPKFAKLTITEDNFLSGEIIYVDGFGNVISNISKNDLDKFGFKVGDLLYIQIEDTDFALKYSFTYGNVSDSSPLALIGGSNFLEVAINKGNASDFFNLKIGNSIKLLINKQ